MQGPYLLAEQDFGVLASRAVMEFIISFVRPHPALAQLAIHNNSFGGVRIISRLVEERY